MLGTRPAPIVSHASTLAVLPALPLGQEFVRLHCRGNKLPAGRASCSHDNIVLMTDKKAVIDALQRLPEDAPLEEISEELRIMAAIPRGRQDIAAGHTKHTAF